MAGVRRGGVAGRAHLVRRWLLALAAATFAGACAGAWISFPLLLTLVLGLAALRAAFCRALSSGAAAACNLDHGAGRRGPAKRRRRWWLRGDARLGESAWKFRVRPGTGGALGAEAIIAAPERGRTAKAWSIFVGVSVLAALANPQVWKDCCFRSGCWRCRAWPPSANGAPAISPPFAVASGAAGHDTGPADRKSPPAHLARGPDHGADISGVSHARHAMLFGIVGTTAGGARIGHAVAGKDAKSLRDGCSRHWQFFASCCCWCAWHCQRHEGTIRSPRWRHWHMCRPCAQTSGAERL